MLKYTKQDGVRVIVVFGYLITIAPLKLAEKFFGNVGEEKAEEIYTQMVNDRPTVNIESVLQDGTLIRYRGLGLYEVQTHIVSYNKDNSSPQLLYQIQHVDGTVKYCNHLYELCDGNGKLESIQYDTTVITNGE